MSPAQRATVAHLLRGAAANGATAFHHGCAVGADTEAAAIATEVGLLPVEHPAGNAPLQRNREIVAASDYLVAAPSQMREVLRSGSWATVRYARAARIPIAIAYPDGTVVAG
jgi:hypothetical protein